MSESKAYERRIGAPANTAPRGKFRDNPDGIGIILPAYRDTREISAARLIPNRARGNGKAVPRVNEAKRALRAAKEETRNG